MSGFFQALWKRAAQSYKAEVGSRLASRGLLYEDLLVETADVKLALSRLPKEVLAAREQRLKRAMVLGSQQRYLPDEVAAKIDPFERYLQPYMEAVEEEKKEVNRAWAARKPPPVARPHSRPRLLFCSRSALQVSLIHSSGRGAPLARRRSAPPPLRWLLEGRRGGAPRVLGETARRCMARRRTPPRAAIYPFV